MPVVISLAKGGQTVTVQPKPEDKPKPSSSLILVGDREDVPVDLRPKGVAAWLPGQPMNERTKEVYESFILSVRRACGNSLKSIQDVIDNTEYTPLFRAAAERVLMEEVMAMEGESFAD